MTESIIHKTMYFAAPKHRVWDFLTKADLVAKWFNRPDKDITQGASFDLSERDTGEVLCAGKAIEMSPKDFMAWEFTVNVMGGHTSRVEWHLADHHKGTILTLKHSGLPQTAEAIGLLRALDKGWHDYLNALYTASEPQSYKATIATLADADTAQKAILYEMPLWWSDRVEKTDTGFTIRFNNSHVTCAFDPENPLHWDVTDAKMIIEDVADDTEWTGTSLIWTITPTDQGTDITLHHKGLNETLDCLDVCTRGWQLYFETSLKAHLSGGTPTPQTH